MPVNNASSSDLNCHHRRRNAAAGVSALWVKSVCVWASRMTISVPKASKLGIAVAKVRKMPHPGLAAKASKLVTAWKELVTKASEAEAKAAMQPQAGSSSSSSGGASGSSSAARSSLSRVAEEGSSEKLREMTI